jgi:hypothetical protein
MILIDHPFVSDYLIQTIKKNNYRVISTPEARALIDDDDLLWIPEKEACSLIREKPETPLYTNSENALGWLDRHLGDSAYAAYAQLFKDKNRFRELIQGFYPDFNFRTVKLEDIQKLGTKDLPFPFVIKPAIGFFSIGVHIVKDEADWKVAKETLTFKNLGSIYPKSVLDTTNFIIEDYIEGEEYAIDCYFDDKGEAVILNIMHHRFSSGADTSDRVYSTSKEIISAHRSSFGNFLQKIGDKAGVKNFPVHIELRIDSSGLIHPIEFNPLRFGGWCTTADLLGIATGYSPYEYYLKKQKPDWNRIFEGNSDRVFSIVVLNNNSGYSPGEIDSFDYVQLAGDFEKPLEIRKMDVKKYDVFGFVFAETSPDNMKELQAILNSDLKKYIRLK